MHQAQVTPDATEDFMTPEKIEARWGITENAVKQAVTDGKLAASRIGKVILVEYQDAVTWIRSLKQPVKEQA